MKFLILLVLTSCSHLFYYPTRFTYFPVKKYVTHVEDIWFNSKDGTKLNGWWMPSVTFAPKGTIVFFHGNAENISSHFLNLAWITHEGYNVFIFDYRGYGASEGKPNQTLIHEDALAALEIGYELYLKSSPEGKFIVYGQSLGGAISMRAINDYKFKDKISLIVQDCAYLSYQDIAFDKLKNHWLTFLISPLAFILVSDEYAADKTINNIRNPLLVIVGLKDQIVPAKFGKEIYKHSKSPLKWIWEIKDGVHSDVFAYHGYKYRKKFLHFLEDI